MVAKMEWDGGLYEGEVRIEVPHGKGVLTWPNGNRYEGEFQFGFIHGQGRYQWEDGAVYEGEFRDDTCENTDMKGSFRITLSTEPVLITGQMVPWTEVYG